MLSFDVEIHLFLTCQCIHGIKGRYLGEVVGGYEGLLLSSLNTKKVCKDSFVYIPKNFEHGLKNTGNEDLELLWIFPTDCWEEVEYVFEK